MIRRAPRAAATLLLAGLALSLLAGCGGPGGPPSGSPSPGSSGTSSSTAEPSGDPTDPASAPPASGPPSSPSDVVKPATATGTVTRGGTGPCYGMTTDDGRELALFSEAGTELVEGSRVTVEVKPAAFERDCGSGTLMQLIAVSAG